MKKRQEIYDLYWYFAYERQNIFLKKISGSNHHGLMIRFYKNINFAIVIELMIELVNICLKMLFIMEKPILKKI